MPITAPKPATPILAAGHRLRRGLVCALPMHDRGLPLNLVNGQRGTVTGTLSYVNSPVGLARNSATIGGSNYDQTATFSTTMTNNRMSFEVWVMFRTLQTSSPYISGVIVAADTAGTIKRPILRLGDGTLANNAKEIWVADSDNNVYTGAGTVSTGVMHQLVGVGDGATLKLYVDGVQTFSGAAVPSLAGVAFGRVYLFRDDATTRSPDACIASARVWDAVLSPGDVQELWQDPWALYRGADEDRVSFDALAAAAATGFNAGAPSFATDFACGPADASVAYHL